MFRSEMARRDAAVKARRGLVRQSLEGRGRAGTDKAVKARCVVACRGGARPVRAV